MRIAEAIQNFKLGYQCLPRTADVAARLAVSPKVARRRLQGLYALGQVMRKVDPQRVGGFVWDIYDSPSGA